MFCHGPVVPSGACVRTFANASVLSLMAPSNLCLSRGCQQKMLSTDVDSNWHQKALGCLKRLPTWIYLNHVGSVFSVCHRIRLPKYITLALVDTGVVRQLLKASAQLSAAAFNLRDPKTVTFWEAQRRAIHCQVTLLACTVASGQSTHLEKERCDAALSSQQFITALQSRHPWPDCERHRTCYFPCGMFFGMCWCELDRL